MANKNNEKVTYGVEFGKSNKEYFPLDSSTTNDTRNGVPKGTSKETMKKLGRYSKNLFKSAGKLSVDIIGQYQPNMTSFANSMSDVAKLATAEAKERVIKMKEFVKKNIIGDKTSIQDYTKVISDTKKDIIERLKSGELYKNSSDNIDMSGMFGDLDFDESSFDFDDSNFDFDDTGDSYSYSDPETTLSDEPFGEDTHTTVSKHKIPKSKSKSTSNKLSSKNAIQVRNASGGISAGNELISSIVSDVGQAIINQQNSLFEKNFAASELRFTQHIETQRGILSGVNAAVEHLQSVESVSSSATMEYQGKMINFQQEQIGLLKEIKEATILSLAPPTQHDTSQNAMQKVIGNGSLNSSEYWKNIKNNASSMLMGTPIGMMATMLPMMGMMGDMGIKQKADPLSSMFRGLIGMSLSSKTKAKLSIADDMMKNAGSLFIGKMNDLANSSKNPFLKNLGKLFGVRDAYVKQADYGLKDPNKIVGWTAKSDRTLNEVIPDRLGEIISALTGKEKEHYDYRTGQFVSQSVAASEYRIAKQNAYSNTIIDNAVTNFAAGSAENANLQTLQSYNVTNKDQLAKELEKDFQKIRMNIGKTNAMFNPARLVGDNPDSSYYRQLTQGVKNPESLTLFINQYSQMSSVDAANFNGQIIKQNTVASRALQSFSDDAILYGGATSTSSLQNLDEADALEYQLEHSSLYNEEELKKQPATIRAQRQMEMQNIRKKVRRLRSGSGGGNNSKNSSALSQYGFSLPSTNDAGGNISTTVGNIFNLLANGILVYTRDGEKLPPHLSALHGAMKSARAEQEEYAKNKALADQAMEEESVRANAEWNNAQYMRNMTAKFGAPSMLRDLLGLNKDRKNIIDKGFNKGFDVFTRFVGKNFAGGVDNSMNDIIDSTYGKNMAENAENAIRSFESKIRNAEMGLKSLEGKKDPFSASMRLYYQSVIKTNTKLIERYRKQTNPATSTNIKDDIINSQTFNNVKDRVVNSSAYQAFDNVKDQVVNSSAYQAFDNAISSVKEKLTPNNSLSLPSSQNENESSSFVEKINTTTVNILNKLDPSKEITEEELTVKVAASMVANGVSNTIEEAKEKVKPACKKIYTAVKGEKKNSGSNEKPNVFDFKNFFTFASSESNSKPTSKSNGSSGGSKASSFMSGFKNLFSNFNFKNPLSDINLQHDSNVKDNLSAMGSKATGFINGIKAGNYKQAIVDKFFTSKEVDMDKVEEEYRTAMSTYAALDELEKSLSNSETMKDMNMDKQINKLIKKCIKSGTIDKDIGDNVIQGIKNYKAKGYPPLFALGKIKEAIKTKYDKDYKKAKRSNSAGAKVLKAIGKWTGTTVGGSYLIASGHPLMAAALIGNSLRTSPTFQNMMKKRYSNNSIMNSVADSLSNKSNEKYKQEMSPFDKFLGITPMSRLTKEDLENEEKLAASSFAAIDEIEKNIIDKKISDKQKLKIISDSFKKGIKSGAINKDIGNLVLNKVTEYSKKGRSPVEALSEAKAIIQKNYSAVIKKERRKRSPASKILKGFGKGLGTTAGSSLLIASGHPLMAAALIGNSLRTSPTFQKIMKKRHDKNAINNEIKDSLFGKATEKYGVEMSPFDKFLGINAMDKMTDKELENEEKLAASSFAAIDEIEKRVSTLNPADKDTPKVIEQMFKDSIKKNLIDKDIGEMVIKRIQNKVKGGGNPLEALAEAKETIQKNYSKAFKRQHRRRSKGSKILRGFGKGIGIGLTAMYNPALAAIMIGREIAKHKSLKAAKEFGSDRDQINEIMGKNSLNVEPNTEKAKTKGGFFSNLMDKFKNPGVQLDTDGDGNAEGTYNDQLNDAKKEKEKKEKEKKEKEKVSLFTNINTTLMSIKEGLGIRDKGDDIDEKDDETLAGKMEQIRKETKKVRDSVQDNTTATVMSSLKGGGRNKMSIFKDLLTVGGGLAVSASVAMNAFKAAERAEQEGAVGVASQLTGLDKSSESNYNYDGTKKQADFHLGGENGVDIDLDRGFERTHNGALIASNAKRWVDAGKRLTVDAKDKFGGFFSKFGKGAAKAAASGADDVAEAVVKEGGETVIKKLPKTVLSKIKDGLTRFLSNKKVAKFIDGKKAKSVIDTIMKKLSGPVSKNVAKSAGKGATKGGLKGTLSQIPFAGWVATIAFVVADFINGMSKTKRYFKIGKNDKATLGMKITAGLVEAIPSLLGIIPVAGVFISIAISMIPPDWLTQNLYKIFVDKEAEEKLKAKQDAAISRANKLGVDADRLNEYENRSAGQNIMDIFRSKKKEDERDAKLLGFETVEEYKEWQKGYDKLVEQEKKENKEREQREKEQKRKANAMNSGSGAPASAAVAAYNKYATSGPTSASNYGPRTSSINAAKRTATNDAWASQANPTSSPTAGYNFSTVKGPKAATEAFKTNRKAMQYQVEDAFNRSPSAAIAFGDQIADSRAKGQQTNINTLSPEFKKRVSAFLNDPRVKGQGVKIREGYRAPLTQYAYYSKGRAPKEVTDALMKKAGFSAGINFWGKNFQGPGQNITWTLASNHFDGNAVDLEPGKVGYDKLGEIAKEYGIEWGGSWEKSPDRPHFEIDKNFKGKIPGVEEIETRTAPRSQYDIEFESTSSQARTADGKVAPENESNKTTNPKVAKQVEEAKVKGTTPNYKVEYGVNGPSHGGASSTSTSTGTKSSTSGGGGSSSGSSYKGSTTSNPATVKESPFVTNDKILVQEMQKMLKVQQEIKEEMVRHNGISEDFYDYIMKFFKNYTPNRAAPKNNNGYLYSNEDESNDDHRFAASTDSLSKGLIG